MKKLILCLAMGSGLLLAGPKCETCERDKYGRILRDKKVTRNFQKANPCPSTGKLQGACPGYIKDHIIPLECGPDRGGVDKIENLQWLTVEQAKRKDEWENKVCGMARSTVKILSQGTTEPPK